MDRRLFVTGLLGVAATTGFTAALPRKARALTAIPLNGPIPQPEAVPRQSGSGVQLAHMDEDWNVEGGEGEDQDQGFQPAYDGHPRRRRRRRRVRRWRRVCQRWRHAGHWQRSCRRRPYWINIWFSI